MRFAHELTNSDRAFWQAFTQLIRHHPIVVDRPRGSAHPRYPHQRYPLNYGYLSDTASGDRNEIDVWIGSLSSITDAVRPRTLTGILCTLDTIKHDAEMKLLVECDQNDIEIIREFHKDMHVLYIPNTLVKHDLSR